MKRIIAAASAATLGATILLAPSATAATETSAAAVTQVKKSDYSKKKQNRFWRVVKSYDPLAAMVGKKSVVDLGIATCDYLRSGADLYDLVWALMDSDAGVAEDSAMAIMAAAPVILCPDQQYKFD